VDRVDQRLSFVTLAVRDLEASRAFYLDGLGWQPALDVPGEVLMIKVGPLLVLSLWDRDAFEKEVGPVAQDAGLSPIALAHNVAAREEVEDVLDVARAAGADPVSDAFDRDWGGRSGYFADPDGFRWEVAWNPGPIGAEVLP
jgi:catechol 2,3-dioxygenase-like lactoylglutathione lyase family enzyme